MSVLAVQWLGWAWLAFLIVAVPSMVAWFVVSDLRSERRRDAEQRSWMLQEFGEQIARAPGDGSRYDALTLHWCPRCQVCTGGCSHWVWCGEWRKQDRVLTVTAYEVTRWIGTR